MRAKKDDVGPTLIKLRLWWETLKQSQALFSPEKVKQQMPVMVRGVLGTRNRLCKIKIVLNHKLPTSVLPLVSRNDTELIKMLFWEAHVDGVDLHLNKNLTVLRLRTGFYKCHIPAKSKMVKSMIENCIFCKKKKLQLEKVPI